MIDNYSYDDHAGQTYGRCPDGTGAFVNTEAPTRGAANACPPTGSALARRRARSRSSTTPRRSARTSAGWPTSRPATSAPGVLWGGAQLRRVLALPHGPQRGAVVAGRDRGFTKTLVYKNGLGAPDAEGVTLADGDPNAVYVATERDGGGGSLPKILRYDTSAAGRDDSRRPTSGTSRRTCPGWAPTSAWRRSRSSPTPCWSRRA